VAPRLPSLKALRAFDAAGRHLSFHKAAQELNVTPAAITHQIKSLEAYLEIPLFRRQARGVVLTDQGRACLPGVSAGFNLLVEAIKGLRDSAAAGDIDATIPPGFAAMWLVPRLHRFREHYPDVAVRFVTRPEPIDLKTLQTDLAIRFGRGDYPGYRVDQLIQETITPLCGPRLLEESPYPLCTPADLRHHTLIHVAYLSAELAAAKWGAWLEVAGLEDVDVTQGLFFDNIQHAVQAAMDGAGVFLGFCALAADEIARGRLVRPFAITVPETLGYYLVCPETIADQPRIKAFRKWIIEEADAANKLG
jgi:LysR family transcriptional regulator, glycine cleavage system transcriptional activator